MNFGIFILAKSEDYLINYKISKLSNGIRVASEKLEHVDSFSLGFWFNVGSRDELKSSNGISHLLEHMFFKGTKSRTARKISEEIETLGGYLNAFTSKEHTCYYGRGMAKNLEKTFSVLSDMVQYSLFDEKELKKEAKVVVDELHDIEDSPEELIFDLFETNIFRGNSLSMPIVGNENNVISFSREDLLDYVDQNYNTKNLYVVASGNVDHEELVSLVNKYFTDLNSKKSKRRKKYKNMPSGDQFYYKDINQAHLIVGGTTYGYNSRHRAVINLISNILGEGSSSRLFQRVRERNGIAYQINTFMNSFYDVSSFGVYLSTNENSLKKAYDLILSELAKMKNKKVNSRELKRAKEYIKGHLQMSLESTSNRMIRMGNSLLYFDRIKPIEESIAEIDNISSEDIMGFSEKLFDDDNISTVLISSKNLLNIG